MRHVGGRTRLGRLLDSGARFFGSVAIAAAAIFAPLVVVVGEATNRSAEPQDRPRAQIAAPLSPALSSQDERPILRPGAS